MDVILIPPIHPNAHKIPPQQPDFLQTPPPDHTLTLDAHFQSIPDDVLWNLDRVVSDGNVRHEATLYGYYNRFLNTAFPSNRWFQVSRPYSSDVKSGLMLTSRLIANTLSVL